MLHYFRNPVKLDSRDMPCRHNELDCQLAHPTDRFSSSVVRHTNQAINLLGRASLT
jgi:hypothetical protein